MASLVALSASLRLMNILHTMQFETSNWIITGSDGTPADSSADHHLGIGREGILYKISQLHS